MHADDEEMHDAPATPPFPVPPRPDQWPAGRGRSVGSDFSGPLPGRSSRLARVLALVIVVCLVAGAAFAPILRAWEMGHRSHEFSFMSMRGGEPIRWNPCEPIHYVVNLGTAPAGSLLDVQDAVLQLTRATGIVFVYDGLTDEVPARSRDAFQPERYGGRWAPVLVGWVDPRTSSFDFDPDGHEAAGVAGPLYPDPGPHDIFVSGVVAINIADPNPPGFTEAGAQGPVVLHELAHVLGLSHFKAQGELMDPSGGGMTGFGPGDLAGLHELGRSAGCLSTPPVPAG
jgi:hypothetical protein